MRLKVFEAFAGIGAQASALKRLNIDYEVVGISEWFIDAILCYDQIQNDGKPEIGPKLKEIYDTLTGIQMGRVEAPEGWIYTI